MRTHLPEAAAQWAERLRDARLSRTGELARCRQHFERTVAEFQLVLRQLGAGQPLLNSAAYFYHLHLLHELLRQRETQQSGSHN